MEMESDADRLAMLKSLGGIEFSIGDQKFWALFEDGYVEQAFDVGVEGTQPTLFMRTSDFHSLQLGRDKQITGNGDTYRIDQQKPDGTGMSRVFLKV